MSQNITPDLGKSKDALREGSAREKVAGAKAVSKASEKTALTVGFKVPDFPRTFNLASATDTAYQRAMNYMNNILKQQDLRVSMLETEDKAMGMVHDMHSGKEISRYDGMQMLKLYAKNLKERGIIVDGKV